MFQDLRSPEAKADAERRQKAEERKRRANRKALDAARKVAPGTWRPIEEMPFAALRDAYGIEGTVLVTDGDKVAIATVNRRCGRPIKVVKQPTMALTDNGIAHIGGEYEEFDRPDWWFAWEFTDELSSDHEMWGKAEVGFVATHWMLLPTARGIVTEGGDAIAAPLSEAK